MSARDDDYFRAVNGAVRVARALLISVFHSPEAGERAVDAFARMIRHQAAEEIRAQEGGGADCRMAADLIDPRADV